LTPPSAPPSHLSHRPPTPTQAAAATEPPLQRSHPQWSGRRAPRSRAERRGERSAPRQPPPQSGCGLHMQWHEAGGCSVWAGASTSTKRGLGETSSSLDRQRAREGGGQLTVGGGVQDRRLGGCRQLVAFCRSKNGGQRASFGSRPSAQPRQQEAAHARVALPNRACHPPLAMVLSSQQRNWVRATPSRRCASRSPASSAPFFTDLARVTVCGGGGQW
jgi:hypothetical protein